MKNSRLRPQEKLNALRSNKQKRLVKKPAEKQLKQSKNVSHICKPLNISKIFGSIIGGISEIWLYSFFHRSFWLCGNAVSQECANPVTINFYTELDVIPKRAEMGI